MATYHQLTGGKMKLSEYIKTNKYILLRFEGIESESVQDANIEDLKQEIEDNEGRPYTMYEAVERPFYGYADDIIDGYLCGNEWCTGSHIHETQDNVSFGMDFTACFTHKEADTLDELVTAFLSKWKPHLDLVKNNEDIGTPWHLEYYLEEQIDAWIQENIEIFTQIYEGGEVIENDVF